MRVWAHAFVTALLSVQFIGCASTDPQPSLVSEALLDRQAQMFDALYAGQPIADALPLIDGYAGNFFDVRQDDGLYQYVQAKHPGTEVLFGLFFKNGKLAALILEQDVADFHYCRSSLQTGEQHWLSRGIDPYARWLVERDRLGTAFDRRAHHADQVVSGGVDFEYVMEAAATVQVLAVALGVYAVDQMAGGRQREKRIKRERQYFVDTAPTIQLGDSEQQLIALMGSYDRRDMVGPTRALTYFIPNYTYGLSAGRVAWKESGSMFRGGRQPSNADTVWGQRDCGSLAR